MKIKNWKAEAGNYNYYRKTNCDTQKWYVVNSRLQDYWFLKDKAILYVGSVSRSCQPAFGE